MSLPLQFAKNGFSLWVLLSSLAVAALIWSWRNRGRQNPVDRAAVWSARVFGSSILLLLLAGACGVALSARAASRTATCVENLRTLSNALTMYSADWNSTLPPAAGWDTALTPYAGPKRETWRCPEASSRWAYALNSAVGVLRLNRVRGLSCVMILEDDCETRDCTGGPNSLPPGPRHPDGDHFALLDGGVRAFPRGGVTSLQWRP